MDVFKIGGSVLVNHRHPQVFDEFKDYDDKAIFVLGCGQRIHDLTIQHQINNGKHSYADRLKGFWGLYEIVEDNLRDTRDYAYRTIPVEIVNPFRLFIKRSNQDKTNPRVGVFYKEIINDVLHRDHYPLTSGGVVLDEDIKFASFSSDNVSSYLAVRYNADRLVMFTDTDGVWKNFKNKQTVPKLKLSEMNNYQLGEGMDEKIRRAAFAVRNGIPTYIANGMKPKAVQAILKEDYSNATEVVL